MQKHISTIIKVLILCSSLNVAAQSAKIKNNIALYNWEVLSDSTLEFIATHFDVVDIDGSDLANKSQRLKQYNPDITIIKYEDLLAMYKTYSDWSIVNVNEDWFVHDTSGNRIMDDTYCWCLMDPATGWAKHISDRIRTMLDAYPQIDGVFGDDTHNTIAYTWSRWHTYIEKEVQTVDTDSTTVITEYKIFKSTSSRCIGEVEGVWDNPSGTGINYFTGGSFKSDTITLGTHLAPGTTVYITYSAKDDNLIKPLKSKINSWHADMTAMLDTIKSNMNANEKLIINTNSDETDFLDIADGKMYEGFVHGSWSADTFYQSESVWLRELNYFKDALLKDKPCLILSGTDTKSNNDSAIDKQMRYCLASYLLVSDTINSSFGFIGKHNYNYDTYYNDWDVDLGMPINDYYLFKQNTEHDSATNIIANNSFEDNFTTWSKNTGGGKLDITIDSTISQEGNKSLKIVSSLGYNSGGVSKNLTLKPFTTYTLSGWIKTENFSDSAGLGYEIYVKNGSDPTYRIYGNTQNMDWTYFSMVFTTIDSTITPYGGVYMERIMGNVWVDNIKLEEGAFYDYKIYARDYSNGIVLVNPTEYTGTFDFDSNYMTLDSENVSTVTLQKHQGMILLNTNDIATNINNKENVTASIKVYPNPFQSSTTIEVMNLPYNLTVYNQLGEKVRKIDNVNTPKFNFNCQGMNKGIYFYRIENTIKPLTGKLVIQ